MMAQGVYEEWVRALREWGSDPHVDLSHLPAISLESFPPATFERLFKHIDRATQKLMDHWHEDLQRQMQNVHNEYELGQVLLHARNLLHRRVLLASHPGLPEKVREALMKETRTQVNSLQQQIEETFSKQTNAWALERSDFLRVVKATPFTAVLDADYGQQTRVMEVVNAAEEYNYALSMQSAEAECAVTAETAGTDQAGGFFRRFMRNK